MDMPRRPYKRQSPCDAPIVVLALSDMSSTKTLTFYLNDAMRKRAIAGQINIINRITNAFESHGYQCLFMENGAIDLLNSIRDPGHSIFHMEDPFHPRALNLRRSYYYPFWQLEASGKRWEWAVAGQKFSPDKIDPETAREFTNYWRQQLFGDEPEPKKQAGMVFAPLQGRLLDQRDFQTVSPLEMLQATLKAEPERQIHVTLHPREDYSTAEMKALKALVKQEARLHLVSTDANTLVRQCDYIVTQNSGLALHGFFQHKPAVLFADIDFHHICQNVRKTGVKRAFENVLRVEPDFNAYIFWFLQLQSINAGRDDAEERILEAARSHGWEI